MPYRMENLWLWAGNVNHVKEIKMKTNGISTISHRVGLFLLAILLVSGVAACASDEVEISEPEVEGPVLVMFYTDG